MSPKKTCQLHIQQTQTKKNSSCLTVRTFIGNLCICTVIENHFSWCQQMNATLRWAILSLMLSKWLFGWLDTCPRLINYLLESTTHFLSPLCTSLCQSLIRSVLRTKRKRNKLCKFRQNLRLQFLWYSKRVYSCIKTIFIRIWASKYANICNWAKNKLRLAIFCSIQRTERITINLRKI